MIGSHCSKDNSKYFNQKLSILPTLGFITGNLDQIQIHNLYISNEYDYFEPIINLYFHYRIPYRDQLFLLYS